MYSNVLRLPKAPSFKLYDSVIAALTYRAQNTCVICGERHTEKKLRSTPISHYGVSGKVLQAYTECPDCGEYCGSTELDLGAQAIRRFKRYAERLNLN